MVRSKGCSLFIKEVQELGIDVVFRQNEQGLIFGITFIDHRDKVVFNGSDLGKNYSAKEIIDQFRQGEPSQKFAIPAQSPTKTTQKSIGELQFDNDWIQPKQSSKLLAALLEPAPDYASLMPKKKRKKKRGQSL